ncbi:MAG: DAK2 domain-containing protein [Actinomycetota bacterium]|nr:DAK2 domain-containing protein [Actinomycetota bacterium]
MQTLARLGPSDLVAVMVAYRDALAAHREVINRLNVYPVPDGDTGTNMSLTVESVVTDITTADGDDLATVAKALAHGSLMGARGNSGVILSQILRGVAKVVGDSDGIDADVLRDALSEASAGAYQAVQNPVEGTILTVIRGAAEAVADGAGGADLLGVASAARGAAAAALAATTDLLPALRAAGVVDSGGAGLLLLFDALLNVVDGRPVPDPPDEAPVAALAFASTSTESEHATSVGSTEGAEPRAPGTTAGTEARSDVPLGGDGGPRYEVMYLLEAPDETVDGFRRAWASIGESIVVVGGDGLFNCHIHTDDIGAAIEAAIDIGRPGKIRVSDLLEEVEEERWVRQATRGPATGSSGSAADSLDRRTAVVAVCSGEGIRRIFESLGVTGTVSGGQSMNPSTAEMVAAIDAAPADQVVILPNNKNIVAVAEAAAAAATKTVRVVATRGIPEGFAALLDYDPEGDASDNATAMRDAAHAVAAGEVTRAVRTAASPVGDVHEGDWIGVSRAGIEVVAPDMYGAATGLLDRLVDAGHHEVATIIVGEGAEPSVTRRITDWLDEHRPGVTGEVHHGGQPLYPYLFGVE